MSTIGDVIEERYSGGQYSYDRPDSLEGALNLPPKWKLLWRLEETLGVETGAWGKRKPELLKQDFQNILDAIEEEFEVKTVTIVKEGSK